MVYIWEFEFFSSGGYVDAVPCGDFGYGATFGENLVDAVEYAVDFLGCAVEDSLIRGVELPPMEFGHKPENGGQIIAIAVERNLEDIPAVTAADAARELGVSRARVAQLCKAGLLESWMSGSNRMVTRSSVNARLVNRVAGQVAKMLGEDAENYYLHEIADILFSRGVRNVSEADADEVWTVVKENLVGEPRL